MRHPIRSGILALSILFTTAIVASPAAATLITVNFTGKVVSVGSAVAGGGINVNDTVTGSFTYDTTAPEHVSSSGDPNHGYYPTAVTSFTITLGSYTASSTAGPVFVDNDNPDDSFSALGGALTGASVNGLAPSHAQFHVGSLITSRLPSDALPPTGIDSFLASEGTSGGNVLAFDDNTFPYDQIRWDLTTINGVPEPAGALLLGLGLVGLGVRRLRAA